MPGPDYARFMADVALRLFGEPDPSLSTPVEWRYGRKGSLEINVQKGTWHDFETETHGGVLDLIGRETGHKNGEAVAWMVDQHIGEGQIVYKPAEPERRERSYFRVVNTWPYLDETGAEVFQVQRLETDAHQKRYVQRRRATPADDRDRLKDGFVYSVKGVRQVPYRLPEIIEAVANETVVLVVEGEKCADSLWEIGIPATTNAMGAGKWPDELTAHFTGADVVILPDNDDAGRKHAALVAAAIGPVASRVRVLDLPGLAPKGDVYDWIKAGGTADALYGLVDNLARSSSVDDAELHFPAMWFHEVEDLLKPPEWLIEGMLTQGDLSLVYGPSGAGKSFLALAAAMAIARGTPVFGHEAKQGGVIYVAAEGGKGQRNRVAAYRQFNNLVKGTRLPFILMPARVNMFAEEGDYPAFLADLRVLAARLTAMGFPPVLLVFDTHAAVSPGANENASEDISQLLAHYFKAHEAAGGVHVMVVHHMNAAAERPRGHTSFFAAVDNALEVVTDDGGTRTVTISKQKDGEDGGQFYFRLPSLVVGQREDGSDVKSCVVEPIDPMEVMKLAAGPKLTDQERIALDSVREALLEHAETPPALMGLPAGMKVVRLDYWKEVFAARAFTEPPDASTLRKAVTRTSDRLVSKHLVGRMAPYIWLAKKETNN